MIVNPEAGSSSLDQRKRVIDEAVERLKVDVLETTEREAGLAIAREAVDRGAEVVIAYGGDGLVNEVANAVAHTSTALGIIPGGTMNVLARDLGIPNDPLDAVTALASRVGSAPRSVPLGRMDDRFFTFAAGCGFDAEAAEVVEAHRRSKRALGEIFFYLSALRVLAGSHRHRSPYMTVEGSFGSHTVSMAVICNTGPYAYLFNRPVALTPEVSLDAGLDLFALRRMRIEALPFYVLRAGLWGDLSKHPDAVYERNVDSLKITSDRPFKTHVDGEPMGESTATELSMERDALRIYA